MQASGYLRMKVQSDRQLSIYAQHGFKSFLEASKSTASTIYTGIERVSWYSSCLIPRYGDVCRELMTEEKRVWFSLKSVIKYRDIITHLLTLYFEMLEKDIKNGNDAGKVQDITKGVTGYIANSLVGKETRLGMAYALAKLVEVSSPTTPAMFKRIGKVSFNSVIFLQVMGVDQDLVMAARRLKNLEPKYYAILCAAQLEMLYYFIEPVLENVITKVKVKGYDNIHDLYNDLTSNYHV